MTPQAGLFVTIMLKIRLYEDIVLRYAGLELNEWKQFLESQKYSQYLNIVLDLLVIWSFTLD